MNTQWELYFLRREIERQKIQKQRKKKRRIWIAGISGLLALVFLAGGISMVRFYRSDYGKLKRAADQYDFRLAAVRMSQYVNENMEKRCAVPESYPSLPGIHPISDLIWGFGPNQRRIRAR